jgi:hypothetical protein
MACRTLHWAEKGGSLRALVQPAATQYATRRLTSLYQGLLLEYRHMKTLEVEAQPHFPGLLTLLIS